MTLYSKEKDNIITYLGSGIELPRMMRVRQILPDAHLNPWELPEIVGRELRRSMIRAQIKPGMRVAVTCGSRGIAHIAIIIKAIVDTLKQFGAAPFVFPAMGSHGGATAEGQLEILRGYGITEEKLGCSIFASMQVVHVGDTDEGMPVYCDKHAYEADAILLCGRIKPHTGFRGLYESGLMKMAVIGMGKQHGAEQVHRDGFSDLGRLLPMIGRVVLEKTKVIGGVGIVENAFDQTCILRALTKDEIFTEEPKLLKQAYAMMGRIYTDNLDVLVVDRIGKDISGDGMDPNVTGRFLVPHLHGNFRVQRVAVLDLSEDTHGNFVGLSNADITTRRVIDKLDPDVTYPNLVTSTVLNGGKIPIFAQSDRTCIQIALKTCNYIDRAHPRVVRIRDTQNLGEIQVSEAMLSEVEEDNRMEIISDPKPWPFNEVGNLW